MTHAHRLPDQLDQRLAARVPALRFESERVRDICTSLRRASGSRADHAGEMLRRRIWPTWPRRPTPAGGFAKNPFV